MKNRLEYRLDPAPFSIPKGAPTTPLAQSIADHFADARRVFLDVYRFFVDEYTDDNTDLGPISGEEIATEIDSHNGHKVIHPDYAEPNSSAGPKAGREAHNNHLHAQLGPTRYEKPRRG